MRLQTVRIDCVKQGYRRIGANCPACAKVSVLALSELDVSRLAELVQIGNVELCLRRVSVESSHAERRRVELERVCLPARSAVGWRALHCLLARAVQEHVGSVC